MCRSNLTHSNLGSPIQAEFPQDPHPQIPTTHLCCRTSLQEIHQDCVWLNRSCRCLPRERGVTGVMSHYCHIKNTVGACWEFRMSVPDASLPSVGRMGGAHLWLKIFSTTYCDKKKGNWHMKHWISKQVIYKYCRVTTVALSHDVFVAYRDKTEAEAEQETYAVGPERSRWTGENQKHMRSLLARPLCFHPHLSPVSCLLPD